MPRVRRIVTSRSGGVSPAPYDSFNLGDHVGDDPAAVAANRRRLAAAAGLAPEHVVWMEQIHGATVTAVDGPRTGPVEACDGLVTATPGVAVAVLVADCVPVLLADAGAGVVAAVHAGRVGAAAGVLRRAVERLVELGGDPGRTDALLGPAVCGACYEVPAQMRAAVESRLPGSAVRTRRGTPGLDLRAGLARQLAGLGVAGVVTDPRCTAEDRELFSHRRDGVTGRQAAVAWIEP
ncbi:MAG: FIG00003370: Multicopper polyphenol oxidase [uncultured Corynebacteriales bacterium]|uniref:Purine nucleoside phosphorylase n=1 Tax=uncultured Mycobacteriales bacterium TaxID=581187 RepID=A0A6J4J6T0_9ACTN|nr:MAG: FIG00003370: Multicopper polyphenol oxidase [uncultured Corynebacteriales bacterium]